jgi:hypothetical protein
MDNQTHYLLVGTFCNPSSFTGTRKSTSVLIVHVMKNPGFFPQRAQTAVTHEAVERRTDALESKRFPINVLRRRRISVSLQKGPKELDYNK